VTSMIGNSGVGAWGASSGWGAPAQPVVPAMSNANVWASSGTSAAPTTNSLFDTSDVWKSSGSGTGASQDLFGGFSAAPAAPAQKKDDAFGDIWGGFK